MPRKNSYLTCTDQFCGAGGSSIGATKSGVEVKLALNHWQLAIDTHNSNFQNTAHDCTDISACDPRRYPSTDILITSPECTNHSLAKGKKKKTNQTDMFDQTTADPAAERSRATMWDVPRFAEYHNYNIIIVENVVDARSWIMWEAWLKAMDLLGYFHKCCYINSQHCWPTPQSRDRMYVVFWKKGNKAPDLNFMPKAYCPDCGKDVDSIQTWKRPDRQFGKYRTQYLYRCPAHGRIVEPYYYAAFNCIDWTDLGKKIGDRTTKLSPNTMIRIQHGLDKYGSDPVVISTRYTSGVGSRVKPAAGAPFPTQVGDLSHGVSMPFQVMNYTPGYTKSMMDPTGTMTCNDHHGIATPFIIKGEHSKLKNPILSKIDEAMKTQTTRQTHGLVIQPIIVTNKGKSKSHSGSKPIGTQTGTTCHGLVTEESFKSFMTSYYNGSHTMKGMTESLPTQPARQNQSLVSFQKPKIEDCYYRMLKSKEVQKAMAFDDTYIVLGNSKEQVKQLGNAVTPPAMEWLVKQCVASLM